MNFKRLCEIFIRPHKAIMLLLVPISTAALISSMILLGTKSPVSIIAYVLSAYTLTVWCVRVPDFIRSIKNFKESNKYAIRWQSDARLRVKASLFSSFVWSALYGALQICLGIYHKTFWFSSIGAYYICLAVMRLFLLNYTRRYDPGERMRDELLKYRACGWIFLVMNLALSVIVFFMLYWNRSFTHHIITAIAMAAYTFTVIPIATVNAVKYRRYDSPVFSASKGISLAAACVSMLTLTSTLLKTFGGEEITPFLEKMMLGGVGVTVMGIVLAMAVYMIIVGTRRLKQLRLKETDKNDK